METLIVIIKNKKKIAFTKELLKSFSFLEVKEEKKQATINKNTRRNALIQAFEEVRFAEEGKLPLKSWDEVKKKLK